VIQRRAVHEAGAPGTGAGKGHDLADTAGWGAGLPLRWPDGTHPGGPRRAAAGIRREADHRPGHVAGPISHAHDGSGEAIYALSGRLLVLGDGGPQQAPAGSRFVVPRGHRHGFRNPAGEVARVLGLRAPPEPALAFMGDIGAALRPGHPARPGPHARDRRPARRPPAALTAVLVHVPI